MKFNISHPAVQPIKSADPVFAVFALQDVPLKLFVPKQQIHYEEWNGMFADDMAEAASAVAFPYRLNYQAVEYSELLKGLYADYAYLAASDELKEATKPDQPDEEGPL